MKRILILITLFFFSVCPAFAQEVSLSISPVRTIAVVKPGKTLSLPYVLKNSGDPAVISLSVKPARITPEGLLTIDEHAKLPLQVTVSVETQINVPETNSVFLQHNEEQKFVITLTAHRTLVEKDYYAFLTASSQPTAGVAEGSGFAISTTVASPILLSITQTGQLRASPRLKEVYVTGIKLKIGGKLWYLVDSSDRIEVFVQAENAGVHQTIARGSVEVQSPFGQTTRVALLPSSILAGSTRILPTSPIASCRESKHCKNGATLTLGGFHLGKYKIKTNVQFAGYPGTTKQISVVAVPFSLLTSLIIVFLVYRIIKKAS